MPSPGTTIRVFFNKTGRARYISHLDLVRAMSRAISRAGIDVWYTQGFNPHMYLTFPLPLSLGIQGQREPMDIRVMSGEYEDMAQRLNSVLPDGIRAISAQPAVMEPKDIVWADYSVELICRREDGEHAVELMRRPDTVIVSKKGKKGIKEVDIRPLYGINGVIKAQNGITVSLRCRAGVETNLNPMLFVEAMTERAELEIVNTQITRVNILDGNLNDFK